MYFYVSLLCVIDEVLPFLPLMRKFNFVCVARGRFLSLKKHGMEIYEIKGGLRKIQNRKNVEDRACCWIDGVFLWELKQNPL